MATIKPITKIRAALVHCVEVLNAIKPSGHEGDSETGEHFQDCELCAVEGAIAHAEEAMTEPET